jgi:hypothetical protein
MRTQSPLWVNSGLISEGSIKAVETPTDKHHFAAREKAVALNRRGSLALWLGPRFLLVLLLLIPAMVQYGDIAEVSSAHKICPGVAQILIAILARHFPLSIYLVGLATFGVLLIIRFNTIVAICVLLFIIGFNILPQLYAVCS